MPIKPGTTIKRKDGYQHPIDILQIGALSFPQHADSVHQQNFARSEGQPVPPTQYAFYGRVKLEADALRARVRYLTSIGYLCTDTDNETTHHIRGGL